MKSSCVHGAAVCTAILVAQTASAQPVVPPAPAQPARLALSEPLAPNLPPGTPPPAAAPSAAPAPTVVVVAPAAPAAAPAAPRWVDQIQLEGFVDAYFSVNWNFPTAQSGANGFRAYDVNNGAALHWVGLNVSYPANPVGGTVSLRFGPSTKLYSGLDNDIYLGNVKQAFASWKPGGKDSKVTLDVGKFDGPYGAEVADSQYNMNYTRTMLNFYGQPFFFTGIRFDWAPVDQFDAKIILTNGYNTSADNNAGKSAGLQLTWKPADAFALSLGYMFGPEQADSAKVVCLPGTAFDAKSGSCLPSASAPGGVGIVTDSGANTRFRHFVDAIIDINPTKSFRMLVNGDYARDQVPAAGGKTKAVSWYGANLGLRYAFDDHFALAGRGEVYWDPDGFTTGTNKYTRVIDGTVTLEMKPTSNLIFKLEGRVDAANEALFQKGTTGSSFVQGTTTLGVVATTN